MRTRRTSQRAGERGNVMAFFILVLIPLLCLPLMVGNTGTMTARSTRTQVAADHIALTAGTVWARGLNRIQENNAQIAFAGGIYVVAKSIKDALLYSEITAYGEALILLGAWQLAAAWRMYRLGRAIRKVRKAVEKPLEHIAQGARGYIRHLGRDSRRVLLEYPGAVIGAAKRAARASGVEVFALIPRKNWLDRLTDKVLDIEDLPYYPMRPAALSKMCPYLDSGAPWGAGGKHLGVFRTRWGWPAGQGTADYWYHHILGGFSARPLLWPLAPVGGPVWYMLAESEHKGTLCTDRSKAPVLFTDFTGLTRLKPLAWALVDRLTFTVVVINDHAWPFHAPLLAARGDTFREPQDHGITGISRVELVNSDSLDGTTGTHRARLSMVRALDLDNAVEDIGSTLMAGDGTNDVIEDALEDLATGKAVPVGVSASHLRLLRLMAGAFVDATRRDGETHVRH